MACPKEFTKKVFLIVMEDIYGVHDYSFHGCRDTMVRRDTVTIRCNKCKDIFTRPAYRLMKGFINHNCD